MPPASARLFTSRCDGSAVAADVPDPSRAIEIFRAYETSGDPLTLLLNRVERVDELIYAAHAAFGVGRDWRKGDVVATLSTKSSGIGYHAGNEDGIIVQLEGSRRWRVWDSVLVPKGPRMALLGFPGAQGYVMPRPESPPLVDIVLRAGDMLYIPPLFGHEGETECTSVSLAASWRGVTAYTAMAARLGLDNADLIRRATADPDRYGALLPDPAMRRIAPERALSKVLSLALDAVNAAPDLRAAVLMGCPLRSGPEMAPG